MMICDDMRYPYNHSKVGNHLLGLHLLRSHLYRNEGYLQAVAILLAGKKRSTPQLNAKPNVVSKLKCLEQYSTSVD